jgi:hypothetical protein
MTFLRMRAAQRGCLHRADFPALDKALGHACTVTINLVEHLVDRLLEDVTDGRHETLDEAIAARLNTVQVTVWRDPDSRLRPGFRSPGGERSAVCFGGP